MGLVPVSIPYRYKQNEADEPMIFTVASKFQSPIGTNKTQIVHDILHDYRIVSIPYRYKQNLPIISIASFVLKSLNPL